MKKFQYSKLGSHLSALCKGLGANMRIISMCKRISSRLIKSVVGIAVFLFSLSVVYSANALNLSQTPLFVGQNSKPAIMFAMSRDQELFYKAYPDYSNLNGGPLTMADTTYRNDFEYGGYYDPTWCYAYTADSATPGNSKFTPEAQATDHKCNTVTNGRWSGNFLNWATMTRMDILRKVLYGGKRSVDTAAAVNKPAQTVLERAFVPKDSHAFVKLYASTASNNVSDFTPYNETSISLCNVSSGSGTTDYPLIRVARGNWSQWSHTEIQQCQWSGTGGTTSFNTSPSKTANKIDELVAKVSVCVPDKDALTNQYNVSSTQTDLNRCYSYESGSFKPIGLLQKNYTNINFGLVTGTWGKADKGGVLRKKASKLAGNTYSGTDTVNEFSDATGVFNVNAATSIINTIDAIKIKNFTYNVTDGNKSYGNVTGNGNDDWRNPIGEIYAETLRYLLGHPSGSAGNGPTSAFVPSTTASETGMTQESTWDDPIPATSWCSKCSIVILSSGPNSFDGDDLTDTYLKTISSSLSRTILNTKTDSIGQQEFGSISNKVFYGGSSVSTQCSILTKKMSEFLGKCPEFPTSGGTYDIAGLAYWAHTNDVRPSSSFLGTQTISTYAVELSEGLPNLQIPVGTKTISFVPVCTNAQTAQCSLVGVAVENITTDTSGNPTSGSYLFYWEDQPWASDYDLDAVQRIQFCVGSACGSGVNADQVKITNTLPYWATGTGSMYMSYIMSGTGTSTTNGDDGPQTTQWVHRTGNETVSIYTSNTSIGNRSWYNTILPQGTDILPPNTASAIYTTSKTFTAGIGATANVKTPLYYAAKYGSFLDSDTDSNANHVPDQANEWDSINILGAETPDGVPDNYFMMKNPTLLEQRLSKIVSDAGNNVSSGSGVSTNSTKLETGTRIYQARFYTEGWYGELRSLSLSISSGTSYVKEWSTFDTLTSPTGRKIFSSASGSGIDFVSTDWNQYTSAQKTALGGDTAGPKVVNWIRGNDVTGYRSRKISAGNQLMGDIVNSTPVYSGAESQGFDKLDGVYGASGYASYVSTTKASRTAAIFVGANDGMLHAINAQTGAELFGYVPSMVYDKLPSIASVNYGKSVSHTYTVDGPVAVGDAYINGNWKTIVVGTMGAGARGIFALDVTNPQSFSKTNVLFEISASDYPQVGNVMGKPIIAPVAGRWKVIFGNGYNSTSGKAELLVIDLQKPYDGDFSKSITAGSATDNGLAGPVALQNSTTGAVETVYAGDLKGNMWKFDLSSSSTSAWGVGLSGSPLFIAKDSLGATQPIFGAPTLGKNNYLPTATMVYFGTGKYLETDDINSTQMGLQQSFYGIADQATPVTYSTSRGAVLHQKTMTATGSGSGSTRNVNDSGTGAVSVDWATKKGWYLDFPAGERIVTKPTLIYDRLLFSTIIPSTDICTFGGAGWLMELVGVGDVFGTDKELLPHNGLYLDFFLPGELTKIKSDKGTILNECNIKGDCSGLILKDPPLPSDDSGRLSWRQIR